MQRKLSRSAVVELYKSGMSAHEIGQKYGVGQTTVWRDIASADVKRRTASEARELALERGRLKPPPYRSGFKQSSEHIHKRNKRGEDCYNWKGGYSPHHYRGCKERDICIICGSTHRLAIHHIDENRCNNSPDNLQVLCNSCHSKHHSRKRFHSFGLAEASAAT